MSDLFHEVVPDDYIVAVAQVMVAANWHVYQILTKRSARLRDLLRTKLKFAAETQHIWWGVSVENRRHGLPRINDLQEAGAKTAFLSIEPLLEDIGNFDLSNIHWVIVGGESGPGARPIAAEWVVNIRQLCRASGVPFFFKQWGGVRKSATGRELDGRTYDELPSIGKTPVPDLSSRKALIEQFRQAWPLSESAPLTQPA